MVVPIPRPLVTGACELRVRAAGSRITLSPVVWTAGFVGTLVLLTAILAAVTAGSMTILHKTMGGGQVVFVPLAAVGFVWIIAVGSMVVARITDAGDGPVCIADPAEGTVEVPRERLSLRNARITGLHWFTFRVGPFPPRPREGTRSGSQLVAIVAEEDQPAKHVPLATGALSAGTRRQAHLFAKRLGVTLELHDAPDQPPERWP